MADTLESLEIQVVHSATGAAEEINSVAKAVRSLSRALEKAIPSLTIFQRTLGKNTFNITDNSSRTTQIGETINNIKEASSGAKSATQEAAKGVRSLAKEAGKAKSPMENFVGSLKRIAFYRFIRTIIKAITSAFTEGLQYAYTFSNGIATTGHRFSDAMDSMYSSSLKMKAQLGSAFIALLTAIEPIVNAIISLVTKLADAMSQFFSVFTGGTYLRATDVAGEFADTMKSGAGSAKEWKNQLMGFDEINKLNEPSGGGGGAGVVDPMTMFEDAPIDGIFKKMKEKIDKLKESLDFEPLRKAWDKLKQSAQALGDTIISGIGWAWDNILAPFIQWWVEKAAPAVLKLFSAILDLVNAIAKVLAPVIEWLWNTILKPIVEWVEEKLVVAIEKVAKILEGLSEVISGKIDFKTFWSDLSTSEKVIFGVLAALALLSVAFFALNHPILAIATAVTLVAYLIAESWDDIKKAITDKIEEIKRKWEDFKQMLSDGWRMTKEDAINSVNKIKEKLEEFKLKAENVMVAVTGFFENIGQSVSEAADWLVQKIDNIVQACKRAVDWLREFFSVKDEGSYSLDIGGGRSYRYNPNKPGLFASGGWPSTGNLFFASEQGPEMVGTIGGNTAVATNDDIVQAIEGGVYRAMASAMSSNRSGSGGVVLNINGREFMRAIYSDYRAVANERGVSLVSGGI